MTPVERNVLPARGPRFFREDGEVMFEFVVDPTNTIGPRVATRGDQAKHAEAWQDFCRAEGISPLDRDADGADGGTLPAEAPLPPLATIDSAEDYLSEAESAAFLASLQARTAAEIPELIRETVEALAELNPPADAPRAKRKYTRRST